MRPFYTIICCLLLVLTGVRAQEEYRRVSGGLARTAALGGNPQHPFIEDYTDVFINPAYAARYTDVLYADIGYGFTGSRASGQSIGVTLSLGSIHCGLSLGRREGYMYAENSYGSSVPTFTSSDYMVAGLNNFSGFNTGEPLLPIQAYAAIDLDDIIAGFGVYRASWSLYDENAGRAGVDEKWDISHGQFGLKGGILFILSPSLTLDVSGLYRMNSSDGQFTDDVLGSPLTSRSYDASGNELSAHARAFLRLSDRMTFVPLVRFSSFSYEPLLSKEPQDSAFVRIPNRYGRSELEFGAGFIVRHTIGMFTIGTSFQRISLTNDVTVSSGGAEETTDQSLVWLDLPKITLGAEFELLSWLTGRLGYFRRLSTRTLTTTPPLPAEQTEQTVSIQAAYAPSLGLTSADQQLSFGLSIQLGPVSIDGYVADRLLAAGPYIVSGNFQDLFGIVSLSIAY